jgi:4-aminobutyrate aminotransferase-like enzyme
MLGRLDAALAAFTHPAARRALKWDLRHGRAIVEDNLDHVPDPLGRARIERCLAVFDARAAPLLPALRTAVIHGDANDHNVLVQAAGPDPLAPRTVTGLIDFGDVVHSFVVGDVAIAAAYAMLGKADPLAAASEIVSGYHAAHPLADSELEALDPLIRLRLCTSVVLSAQQRKRRPDNAYLAVSEDAAWALLARLDGVSPALAHYTFRHAAGLEPCPAGARVRDWLAARAGRFAPVLGPALAAARSVVLDLGVASTDLGGIAPGANAAEWAAAIERRLRAAHAVVGIGRRDEIRWWNAADAFRVAAEDGDDWRTLHLGIDLFVPPGTPVFAPLDGIVRAVADHAAPLDYGPTVVLEHEAADDGLHFFTLWGHLARESLSALRPGAPIRAGDRIGEVGRDHENGGWAPHVHVQVMADPLGMTDTFPGVARPAERAVWLSVSPHPAPLLGLEPDGGSSDCSGIDALVAARRARMGAALSIAYRRPLHIVRGWMQHLYDAEGQRYLDAVNNVAHVGHSHPRVVDALSRQAAVLNTNTRYLHETVLRYAERLGATLPEPLRVLFFVCSGSEANELALRMARTHTHRRGVVVLGGAYHGNTTALIELSPYKYRGPGGGGAAPHVFEAPLPDTYRGSHREGDGDPGFRYADEVGEALARAAEQGHAAGAFFCEPLPGCGGQIIPPAGWLARAFRHARDAGALCIADEVQTGFGRVGSHFWAFQALGAVPDIVTMGKPIGNGHPLGAVATTPEIAASFANGMEYFNTFGGNPVSCAAGLAVLDVIEDENLQENARHVGDRLLRGLRSLRERHELIGDVRGLGLYIGVELVLDRAARAPAGRHAAWVAERMRDLRVLVSTDGPNHNVLKIKPPLVFDDADADALVAALDRVLAEDAARAR